MENTKLLEYIKLRELVRDLVVTEGVGQMGSFGIVLASRIFVKVLESRFKASCQLRRHRDRERPSTYVRPRCDDTHLRRQSPISMSFSDGSGLRHSVSKSYQGREDQQSAFVRKTGDK